MGLLDFLTQGQNADGASYSDVPIGYRLGVLGNVLSAAAQGQAVNPNMFIGMAKMKEDAAAQRKQAKQLELASKYLDKRPDLKPLVESGAISIADIIKMDREDATKAADRKYEEDWWVKQKQWEADHDPNKAWFEALTGGGGSTPAVSPGVESVTPTATGTEAAPQTVAPGVPPPPASGTPAMPPVPGDTANGAVHPTTARLRDVLKDPSIDDNEAAYIIQTVRNPDDLRGAYDTILKNRTERAKVAAAEAEAAAKKDEAAKKEQDSKNSSQAAQMTAVSAIDSTLASLDAEGAAAAGTMGYLFSNIPGTNAYNARTNIDTLKSYISLDKLQNMRANSTTGASGLGQVSNYEQKLLGNAQGAVDQGLDADTLRTNLKVVRNKIIAFNTPSPSDPSKSVLTVDAETLAANPSPEAAARFDAKYGAGSSSVITGSMTPSGENADAGADPTQLDADSESIVQEYLKPQGAN